MNMEGRSNVPSLCYLVSTPLFFSFSASDHHHHLITSNLKMYPIMPLRLHPVPLWVAGMRLISLLMFKNLINDSWQGNHNTDRCKSPLMMWRCLCESIHIDAVGRGLCDQDVNVPPAQWALPCNYMSTPNKVTLGSLWLWLCVKVSITQQ